MSTRFYNIKTVAKNGFTATQRVAEDAVAGTLSILYMADLKSFTVELEEPSALAVMVDKLDNQRPDSNGYVTYLPELRAIMSELSDLVPLNVFHRGNRTNNEIDVEVKLAFSLERDLL